LKTNILYEEEKKDSVILNNDNKLKNISNNDNQSKIISIEDIKELNGGENNRHISTIELDHDKNNQLRKVIFVQSAFKRFKALKQKKKLREEKVYLIIFHLV